MATVITRYPHLEIDGVPLATPAWEAMDLHGLLQGADQRGSDRLLPGASGVRAYKRRPTVSKRPVRLVIFGDYDREGVAYADPFLGLVANIDYLRANVADPTGTGDGTRTAVLRLTALSSKTGPVHVEGLELSDDDPPTVRGVLMLSLPAGALV